MKKYQGKSGLQILKASKIQQYAGGEWQIAYEDMQIFANEDFDQIHIRSIGGLVASLPLGPRGQKLAEKMAAECEAKYTE